MLYFGFYNDKTHTQDEIANMLFISQPAVSQTLKKIVKRVGKILEEKEFMVPRTKGISESKIKQKKMRKRTAVVK